MGLNGVPVRLLVFPLLALMVILYMFFGGSSVTDKTWQDEQRAQIRKDERDLQQVRTQLADTTAQLKQLQDMFKVFSEQQKAHPIDHTKPSREKEQNPHKVRARDEATSEADKQASVAHHRAIEAQADLSGRAHCYYVTGNGVGDMATMGMYKYSGETVHNRAVYYRHGGAWQMEEKWMASTADGHWFISQVHDGLETAQGGIIMSTSTAENPDAVASYSIFSNNEWHHMPEFHVLERSKQDCSEIPELDDVVPRGGTISPVNGTHFVANFDVSDLKDQPDVYKYPEGKRAFTYIKDREGAENFPPFTVVSEIPKVYYFERFMSDEECDAVVDAAHDKITRSGVAPHKGSTASTIQDIRTSSQTWLTESVPAVNSIMNRLMAVTGFTPQDHEAMQVLRYQIDQKYDAHHDYFDPKLYGPQTNNRALTCFLYLSDVPAGGHTWFPRANGGVSPHSMSSCTDGLKVVPIKGSAACFYDMRPDFSLDPYSLHGGCPVIEGTKWGGTLWMHALT